MMRLVMSVDKHREYLEWAVEMVQRASELVDAMGEHYFRVLAHAQDIVNVARESGHLDLAKHYESRIREIR